MYFDDPADAFDRPAGRDLVPVIAVTAVVTVGFFLFPDPLLDSARNAAATLVAGVSPSGR